MSEEKYLFIHDDHYEGKLKGSVFGNGGYKNRYLGYYSDPKQHLALKEAVKYFNKFAKAKHLKVEEIKEKEKEPWKAGSAN